MDKLKMQPMDMAEKNIEKIGALFPNVITEMKSEDGKLKKGIDFEKLNILESAGHFVKEIFKIYRKIFT